MAHFDSFWGSAAFRCWKVQSRRKISWKRKSKIWPLLARVRPLFQPLSVGIAEHFLAFKCLWILGWGRRNASRRCKAKSAKRMRLPKKRLKWCLVATRTECLVSLFILLFCCVIVYSFFRRKSLLRQSSPSFIFTLSVSDDIPSVAAHLKTVQRPRVGMLPILQREQRIQMLEDAEQKKQEIEKEREELTLGGSLFLYQVKWKRVVLFVSDMISGSDQPAFFPYTSVFVLLRVQKKPSFRCITHYCTLVGDSCRDGGLD